MYTDIPGMKYFIVIQDILNIFQTVKCSEKFITGFDEIHNYSNRAVTYGWCNKLPNKTVSVVVVLLE